MADENDRFKPPSLPDDEGDDYTDDDVPFKLPKAENSGSFYNIHKDPTEELDLSGVDDDDPYEQATTDYDPSAANGETAAEETTADEDDDEIARIQASDPPLASGPPEDNTMVKNAWKGEADDADSPVGNTNVTAPHDAVDLDDDPSQYTTDTDVPFKLPRAEREDDAPVGSKFVTMPNQPGKIDKNAEPTLPGSGGLDPNPDFVAGNTIANQTVQAPSRQGGSPPAPVSSHQQNTVANMPAVGNEARYQRGAAAGGGFAPPVQRDTPAAPYGQSGPGGRPLPRQGARRRKRRLHPGCLILLVMFLTFCGGLTLITTVGGAFAYVRVGELLNEQLDELDSYTALQSNTILDRNGNELFTVFSEQGMRINIDLDDLPQYVIDATLAIEDDKFYNHIGIDIPATTIAVMQYLGAPGNEDTAGGSTITQQLVRNVLFSPEYRAERSPQRKAEEIALAIALEARRSKEDILELYLNEIYYGNLAYGIEAAAEVIFDKSATELTIGEAALLAGLPNIPAFLDPLSDDPAILQRVENRRLFVLEQMLSDGFITQAQHDAAIAEDLQFSDGNIDLSAPHFTVYALDELNSLLAELGYSEEQIAAGGLNVLTTVDLGINNMAQEVAAQRISEIRDANNARNASVLVMNPSTGEIMAMVGSIDYYNEAIDGNVNVAVRPRQPGSTMKSFTFAAALERGMSTGDIIWDTPIRVQQPGQPDYVPRNYDGGFHGPMRMRTALANSYNIPAVQVMRFIGVDYLLGFMERLGTESLGTDASRYGISLTLGGGEITLLELVNGYSVFANEGQHVGATAILCVWDNDDTIVYEYNGSCPNDKSATNNTVSRGINAEQVLDPRIAFAIADILGDNQARAAEMGSNSPLFTPNITSSAKTGTTDDIKDNWTVGFTSNVAVGVWVGNNDGDSMVNTSGLRSAAPIWNRVLTTIYDTPLYRNEFAVGGQLRTDQRNAPNGITLTRLCNINGLQDPAVGCGGRVNEWVLDSPAGQYLGNGELQFPPAEIPSGPPPSGSYVREVEPGVFETTVVRLDPGVANAIQFNLGANDRQPPPPLYCRVPVELIPTTPGAQTQLFLPPPASQSDAVEAELYARQRNLAFLPTIDCNADLATGGGAGQTILTAYISAPTPGQVLPANTDLAITGTAQFTPQQAEYYKIDLIGGQFGDWTTIGPVRNNPVVNGQLDTLPALPPGEYRMRLTIVGVDGNDAQPGFEVPFIVQ